ncbi:MAG TPA: thioredoxin domain-containing protein [Gemmatimonadales bacterium]|jgi:protein-disulfide isomerase
MIARNIAGNILTAVIAGCAVIVTVVTVRRSVSTTSDAESISRADKTVPVWTTYLAAGNRIGNAGSPVKILEFGDFECPVCGEFARSTLRGIRTKYGDQVQVVFRNWPLPYHRFAYPAARAAECAAAQGKFESYFDAVYNKQDSLGLKTFESFARESHVPDIPAFDRCNSIAGTVPSVEADIAAAKAIGGHGTPTIVINGMMIANSLDSTRIDSLVRAAIAAAR